MHEHQRKVIVSATFGESQSASVGQAQGLAVSCTAAGISDCTGVAIAAEGKCGRFYHDDDILTVFIAAIEVVKYNPTLTHLGYDVTHTPPEIPSAQTRIRGAP